MQFFWNSVLRPALEALRPKHVVEVGAAEGLVTHPLAELCARGGAALTVIDFFPRFDTAAFLRCHPHVRLLQKKSIDALPDVPDADVVLLDGDHNWYTVHTELSILAARHGHSLMPVVFVHDTGWPYGRRDLYYSPDSVPPEHRQPFAVGGVSPGLPQLLEDAGLNQKMFHARTEGGPKNGVAAAVDDFVRESAGAITEVRLPVFHGLSILFPAGLPDAHPAFAAFLADLKRTPMIDALMIALEDHRVRQMTKADQLSCSAARDQDLRWRAERIADSAKNAANRLTSALRRMELSRSWRWTVWLRHLKPSILLSPRAMWTMLVEQWRAIRTPAQHSPSDRNAAAPEAVRQGEPAPRPEEVAHRFHAGASSLSVIVTARNNGPYLRECLQSILDQTIRPSEVIYCDDGSTDDSVAVARSMQGIRVIARPHAGVVAARNAAVEASSGNLLLHVDGDDTLTPSYIAAQLEKLAWHPEASFAYGGTHRFDMENADFDPPEWDPAVLWKENYINTSSLVRREAFLAAGGWRDTIGTMWDWDLWLRISRIGPGVRCGSVLNYRRHPGSWSQVARQMDRGDIGLLMGRGRRAAARISVCCVYGGRIPELLPQWFAALAGSIRAYAGTADKPELIVLDNSPHGITGQIHELAGMHPEIFRSVVVIPYPERIRWQSEMERRHKVAMFLGRACNRLLATADGDVVWFVEDDVVVPEHAYGTLLEGLTDGVDPPAAVSGLYRNRHVDDWVAHHVDKTGNVLPVDPSSGAPFPVDLAGTGCLMIFRPFAPHPFGSHWRGFAAAHDWSWCDQTRRNGKRIMLYPSVRCRHYSSSSAFI